MQTPEQALNFFDEQSWLHRFSDVIICAYVKSGNLTVVLVPCCEKGDYGVLKITNLS